MTKYCDSCHSANKDHAKYCCLCKGKFSGVRFGAHISASAFQDARAGEGQSRASPLAFKAPIHANTRRSVPRRTGLLLVFVVLMLGPFTYWDSNRTPELWPQVKSSVTGAWHRSVALIDDALKPSLTATSTGDQPKRQSATTATAELNRPRVATDSTAEGPAPTDAPLTAIAPPAGGGGVSDATECSEVRAALALCPKK